jgi:hypothetical protein
LKRRKVKDGKRTKREKTKRKKCQIGIPRSEDNNDMCLKKKNIFIMLATKYI